MQPIRLSNNIGGKGLLEQLCLLPMRLQIGLRQSQHVLIHIDADHAVAAGQGNEIGSSAAFGTVDVLVAAQSDGMRRHAFEYLAAHLPGVPLQDLRMLVNHPMTEINPGTIIVKEGETPRDALLLLSGQVEKTRTPDKLNAILSAGSLLGCISQ